MFRARFHEVFPRSTPHFGPQDIERGAVEQPPGSHIERLLCALLGLVLNRKKEVEYGRHPSPVTITSRCFSENSLRLSINHMEGHFEANFILLLAGGTITRAL